MKYIADLHIHSKYARSCSNRLDVENIWKSCIFKWIDIIWTWDFTHPSRLNELKQSLIEDNSWFLVPKQELLQKRISDIKPFLNQEIIKKIDKWFYPRFVLQTEINSNFERWWKKYRIHNCILIDSFENADKILEYLSKFGKVESDGRLTVKQDQKDTVLRLKQNFPSSIFFSAHIWTPYFGVLGSKYGFDSMSKAYGENLWLIDAIETWLSSDPIMNWINPEIDNLTILSNSDAHSPENFAREANIFEAKSKNFPNYKDLEKAIKNRKFDKSCKILHEVEKQYLTNLFQTKSELTLLSTIEFYPQEGKYFWDGHSKCNFLTTPNDTIRRNWLCPICGKKLIIWVFHRSFDIGDDKRISQIHFGEKEFWKQQEINEIAKIFDRPNYQYIVPLWDIIREVFAAKKWTKKAEKTYNELLLKFGTEFEILLNLKIENATSYHKFFGYALEKVRNSEIFIKPWYDGVFGVVSIKEVDIIENEKKLMQDGLF